jgi:hypothetical protein
MPSALAQCAASCSIATERPLAARPVTSYQTSTCSIGFISAISDRVVADAVTVERVSAGPRKVTGGPKTAQHTRCEVRNGQTQCSSKVGYMSAIRHIATNERTSREVRDGPITSLSRCPRHVRLTPNIRLILRHGSDPPLPDKSTVPPLTRGRGSM